MGLAARGGVASFCRSIGELRIQLQFMALPRNCNRVLR